MQMILQFAALFLCAIIARCYVVEVAKASPPMRGSHHARFSDFSDLDGDGNEREFAFSSEGEGEFVIFLNNDFSFKKMTNFELDNDLWRSYEMGRFMDINGDGCRCELFAAGREGIFFDGVASTLFLSPLGNVSTVVEMKRGNGLPDDPIFKQWGQLGLRVLTASDFPAPFTLFTSKDAWVRMTLLANGSMKSYELLHTDVDPVIVSQFFDADGDGNRRELLSWRAKHSLVVTSFDAAGYIQSRSTLSLSQDAIPIDDPQQVSSASDLDGDGLADDFIFLDSKRNILVVMLSPSSALVVRVWRTDFRDYPDLGPFGSASAFPSFGNSTFVILLGVTADKALLAMQFRCEANGTYVNPLTGLCTGCPPRSTDNQSTTSSRLVEGTFGFCRSCPPGRWSNNIASSGCARCIPGRYQPDYGAATCIKCPDGQYQEEAGSTRCVSCSFPFFPEYGASECLWTEGSSGVAAAVGIVLLCFCGCGVWYLWERRKAMKKYRPMHVEMT